MSFYLIFQKDQRIAKLVNGVLGASAANHVALENKLEAEKLSDIQKEMENLVLNSKWFAGVGQRGMNAVVNILIGNPNMTLCHKDKL